MERMQVLVDTSENTPPRGFPEFDKLQLDPVRREYMKKLRIKMLDHNEGYLAKHPQVEAILRLIVMEVLCHKPFDVRKFIKELLNSPNLETRVAKVILSKRINLERNHTREYYTHVAEWEHKAGTEYEHEKCDTQKWPEPRPAREERRSDKPGYSHLHYFKEPYWLHPKELMKVEDESDVKEMINTTQLPDWKLEFFKAEFFQKWGPFHCKDKKSNKERRSRRVFVKPKYAKLKTKNKKKKTVKPTAKNRKRKSTFRVNFDQADYSHENRRLILKCPPCRICVANLRPEMDDLQTLKALTKRSSRKTSIMDRPVRLGVEKVVNEVEDRLKRAEGLQVHRDGERLVDERDRPLVEVVPFYLSDFRTSYKPSYMPKDIVSNWEFKFLGDQISYVIPSDELKEEKTASELNEGLRISYSHEEIPEKYKVPEFQVIINRNFS